jgi:hypothetical protein
MPPNTLQFTGKGKLRKSSFLMTIQIKFTMSKGAVLCYFWSPPSTFKYGKGANSTTQLVASLSHPV